MAPKSNRQQLYLPLKFKFQKSGICGNSGVAYIQYEYFPFLLKNQIRNRRNLNQYFQETEIWFLLYKMISTEAVFQKNHGKIGDFSPKNILLNENGQIRIISTISIPNQTDNFQKIVEQILTDVYLAPQQMSESAIQNASYPDKVDPNKAQIFSIGITLLEVANLEDCSFLYTRNPLKIQSEKLQKIKNAVSKRYGPFLNQILNQITQIEPKKRRSAHNILEILKPYQSAILQLQTVNWSTIQHSSIKTSAYFNDGRLTENNKNSRKY